ncbi:MAG: hypothetical protein ABIW50_08470, partial [Candidatus Limnocylindria bacterium]
MSSTVAVPRAHAAKILPILLALVASLLVPAQFVAADETSVTIQKTTSASGNQSPGAAYSYTITTTTILAVQELIVADSAFDYPQIAIESVSYSLNGTGSFKCGSPRPDNIRCPIGSVAADTTVVVTVNVRVNSNVDVACDKPGAHGTLDNTVLNIGRATWTQSGLSYSKNSSRVTVRLNCTGYNPAATPTPTTTILTGPTGNTTKDSATFTFVGAPSPTSYRCALDGGSFAACSSPKMYSGLGLGSHTFEVQGVNVTGPGLPVSRDWTAVSPFTDTGSSAFKNDIFWLYNRGITAGCSA